MNFRLRNGTDWVTCGIASHIADASFREDFRSNFGRLTGKAAPRSHAGDGFSMQMVTGLLEKPSAP